MTARRSLDLVLGSLLWLYFAVPALLWVFRQGWGGCPPRELVGRLGRGFACPTVPPEAPPALLHWLILGQVLRGTMSLVGPRPLTPLELRHHQTACKHVAERLNVAPGWLSPAAWAPPQAGESLRWRLELLYARQPNVQDDLALLWEAWCQR